LDGELQRLVIDEVVSNVDTETLLDETPTIKRCVSPKNRSDYKIPWSFYYQCGVELMDAGDAQIGYPAEMRLASIRVRVCL